MLAASPTMIGELVWTDREGKQAKTTLRFPFSLQPEQAFSSLTTIAGAMQGISDAFLLGVNIRYRYYEDAPDVPALSSDTAYYLCLYYSNDLDIEPVFIPSPNPSLLETEGRFAGIRLDLANPEVASLADALTSALQSTVGPDDVPWSRVLLVGGRTL